MPSLTMTLASHEAEVYFAPGRGFTIWADAVVHHTVRAEGLIGCGVIRGLESPSVFSRGDGQRKTMSAPGPAAASIRCWPRPSAPAGTSSGETTMPPAAS